MRDVLIDDRDPLVVDRDDEGVAKLAERNHRPDVGRRRRPAMPAPPGGHVRRRCSVAGLDAASSTSRRGAPAPTGSETSPPPSTPGSAGATGGRTGALGPQLQLRHAALPERVHQRPPHDFVHERLLAEPDLGLRRVDVDVDARPAASR